MNFSLPPVPKRKCLNRGCSPIRTQLSVPPRGLTRSYGRTFPRSIGPPLQCSTLTNKDTHRPRVLRTRGVGLLMKS